jgi:hypothetical protein
VVFGDFAELAYSRGGAKVEASQTLKNGVHSCMGHGFQVKTSLRRHSLRMIDNLQVKKHSISELNPPDFERNIGYTSIYLPCLHDLHFSAFTSSLLNVSQLLRAARHPLTLESPCAKQVKHFPFLSRRWWFRHHLRGSSTTSAIVIIGFHPRGQVLWKSGERKWELGIYAGKYIHKTSIWCE